MKTSELLDKTAATVGQEKTDRRYSVLAALGREQMAAAEGWRSAHGITDQAEAMGELIRLGLLSEVAKIYRLVSEDRTLKPRGEPSE